MIRLLLFAAVILLVSMDEAETVDVPLEINDGGYIFVHVKINGSIDARFILDTGGGINVISSSIYDKIKSNLTPLGSHTGTRHNGEQITGTLYSMPSLSVGAFSQPNVAVGMSDGFREFDGILSMDFFRSTPFSIDFPNKKLTIESARSLGDIQKSDIRIPIELKARGKYELDFFVNVCLNDSVSCKAEFDTGAGYYMLMVHPSYMEKLGISKPNDNVNYGYYTFSTRLAKLSYCADRRLVRENVFIGFKDGLIYEGLIGSAMFSQRKLTIDIPGKQMIVN